MTQDILVKENMIFRSLHRYLHKDNEIIEIKETFRSADGFELNPKRPRKVHTFIFRTNTLLNMFHKYKDLFQDYPYFKINITQARVMPYITYVLKDKELINTEEYTEFKKLYNEKYGPHLQKLVDKTSKSQCYRLKGTVILEELPFDEDVELWMEKVFKPVLKISL